jgi:exopolysaccharide biosynthesis predicted pyruvyltransferase EpsI
MNFDGRLDEVEKTTEVHKEKIAKLECFRSDHEKKHETHDKEHIINTTKLQTIEKALFWILGIIVSSLIYKLFELLK